MPTTWDNYLKEVMPDVSGCPISTAKNAIRNAAIEFCNESRAWRTQIGDVTTADGTKAYTLVPPADSEIITITRAIIVGDVKPLNTISNLHLNRYKLGTETDRPVMYNAEYPGQITFYRTPNDIYTVEIFATLKSTKIATDGPDFLFNDWLEIIAHGAKGRLMAMAGRSWSNPQMVPYHSKKFINGWVEARIRDSKSNVESSSALRPLSHGFYRSRRV